MKRNSRLIAILLTAMVALSTSFSFAGDSVTVQAKYTDSWSKKEATKTVEFYYVDSYFEANATSYNEHLATASMAVAMAAGNLNDANVKAALTDAGFTDYKSQDYGSTSDDSIGVAVARKGDVVAVAIRGAGYEKEWKQNFIAGSEGNSEGFQKPADKVVKYVNQYVGNAANTKIWITGYSRGGAVANLAAKILSDTYGMKNVYAYCFSAPQAANPADSKYTNIHCVNNINDGITMLLPSYMGFGVYGKADVKLGIGSESSMLEMLDKISTEKANFASPSKFKWGKLTIKLDVKKVADLINKLDIGGITSYIDSLGGEYYTIEGKASTTTTEFWDVFYERIQKAIPSRAEYVSSGMQEEFGALAEKLNSMTEAELKSLVPSFDDMSSAMKLLPVLKNNDLVNAVDAVQKGDVATLEKYSDAQWKNVGTGVSTLLSNKLKIDKTAKPIFILLASDYKEGNQLIGTLLYGNNLKILAQGHYLEPNMAWLMTQDSYYNGVTPGDDVKIATTKISKLTAAKKAFTVKWSKKSSNLTGYQIQYSTSKSFASGNKTVKITSKKTTSKKISKLKAKKKYYVRIRCYKNVNGKPVYGDWSASKSVTTKK